jgi:hypothetical protein
MVTDEPEATPEALKGRYTGGGCVRIPITSGRNLRPVVGADPSARSRLNAASAVIPTGVITRTHARTVVRSQ